MTAAQHYTYNQIAPDNILETAVGKMELTNKGHGWSSLAPLDFQPNAEVSDNCGYSPEFLTRYREKIYGGGGAGGAAGNGGAGGCGRVSYGQIVSNLVYTGPGLSPMSAPNTMINELIEYRARRTLDDILTVLKLPEGSDVIAHLKQYESDVLVMNSALRDALEENKRLKAVVEEQRKELDDWDNLVEEVVAEREQKQVEINSPTRLKVNPVELTVLKPWQSGKLIPHAF